MADPARIDGDQQSAEERVPIVFVPGLMGTRMRFGKRAFDPDGLASFNKLWIEGISPIRRRKLIQKKAKILDKDKGHFSGRKSVVREYRSFFDGIESDSDLSSRCPLFVFGYNWKDSNPKSGKKLAKAIESLTKAPSSKKKRRESFKKVIIVTHSMGGLVARHALKESGLADKVKAVIHVAHPAAGAPKFLRMIHWGAKPNWGERGAEAEFFGESGAAFSIVATQVASTMELLPTSHYTSESDPWCFVRYVPDDFKPNEESWQSMARKFGESRSKKKDVKEPPLPLQYDGKFERGGLYNENTHTLPKKYRKKIDLEKELKKGAKKAIELHRKLASGSRPDPVHPNTYVLYGDRERTDIGVRYNITEGTNTLLGVSPVRTSDGDGTVPASSARAFFADANHAALDRHFNPDRDQRRQFRANLSRTAYKHSDIFRVEGVQPCLRNLISRLARQKS